MTARRAKRSERAAARREPRVSGASDAPPRNGAGAAGAGRATAQTAGRAGDELWDLARRWQADEHLKIVRALSRRIFHRSAPDDRAVSPAIDEAFLVDGAPASTLGWLWRELRWGVAMNCLGRNIVRALGIRLTRARWWWMQWRAGWSAVVEPGNHISR